MRETGYNVASVSYDPVETLHRFAALNQIEYPMLSDQGSVVIKRFGIMNPNFPPDHAAYGVPFPVDYLVAPDATVIDRMFVPDYRYRPSPSEILLNSYGKILGKGIAESATDELIARVLLSSDRAYWGQELAVTVSLSLKPGWHVYGEPLPDNYTITSITFEDKLIEHQAFDWPEAKLVRLASLNESLPVYDGKFSVNGRLLTRQLVRPASYQLKGTLRFQTCNDQVCNPPEALNFNLPLTIETQVSQPK